MGGLGVELCALGTKILFLCKTDTPTVSCGQNGGFWASSVFFENWNFPSQSSRPNESWPNRWNYFGRIGGGVEHATHTSLSP